MNLPFESECVMLCFESKRPYVATQLERGDKYDRSVVFLLETLEADAFLVRRKGHRWEVIVGTVSIPSPKSKTMTEPKVQKPQTKKVEHERKRKTRK